MRGLRTLSLIAAIAMFFVLLGGAAVTKTGSGQECGAEWPLCNGKFIPAYTLGSLLEYSHRLVSGITGILVLTLFLIVFMKIKRRDIRFYAAVTLLFTLIQAVLGAFAVVLGQTKLVMALHFGFSLIAFAAVLLMAIAIWRIHLPHHPSGWGEAHHWEQPVSTSFMWWVFGALVYTYVVVYIGAYVRHTDSVSGCVGWPLCNGAVIPELTGTTTIAFIHRISAALLLIVIALVAWRGTRDYKESKLIRRSCLITLYLVMAQIFSGAIVVFTLTNNNLYIFSALLHTVLVAGLFGMLCYLAILVWQLREGNHERRLEDALGG